MRLTRGALNRTLLRRQHLLDRADADAERLVTELLGLQAQDTLPAFLSLHARSAGFTPAEIDRGLEERRLVRVLTLRGTLHLHTAADALALRPWAQPVLDRVFAGHAAIEPDRVRAAVDDALADGPISQRDLAATLSARLPDVPASEVGVLARCAVPLVQLPPRGTWAGAGTIVYDRLDRWLDRPVTEPDVADVVRRYLSAYGPASAADVTTWSGVTRLGPVLRALPDLVRHEDPDGKVLYDVPDGVLEAADTPAPPRLLGTYDNLWLSHAGRDRVTGPAERKRWMGPNGGAGMCLFVDGWLEGLWRVTAGRVEVIELFRDLTSPERAGLDEEIARVETLLAH